MFPHNRFGHSSRSKSLPSNKIDKVFKLIIVLCTNHLPHFLHHQQKEASSSAHFDGAVSGTSTTSSQSRLGGSLSTSSNLLLAKIRTRNAHTYSRTELRSSVVQDIHGHDHGQLLSQLRDFIATRCKTDGQATTAELLKHFSEQLPSSDTVLFKSLLHEICTFHRHLGEGLWSLKPEFR